jgi:serine/threonine-protein kinase
MPEAVREAGFIYGKYFLMKKLAAGGMGEIFLAKQQGPAGFQKILVVKKILSHLTENKEFIEAFLGEARLAAQMNHRNIVQVYELGEQDRSYFIAMEYVQGKSLRDVIDAAVKRKEKMPSELCRLIAEQICDGASYAHNLTDMSGRSLNLVHRDLNPQNVLISYTGDVKIIDFGIAKSEMSTVKTEAGMIKGKFVYMSPEQSGAKKLDKRSDIFPIGITLYEMLTGINPFHKNNIVLTLEAVQRYEPPPPGEYDPSYAPFDPIVAKALAKDRDRRYADASEMQDDLRRIVLPRPPERLGQFMARIFRQQLEEEQKLLMDSDSMKLATPGPKRTPPKGAPAHTPPKPAAWPASTTPEGEAPAGSTMMLPSAPPRRPQITPSKVPPAGAAARPASRPAPAAQMIKPQGAGDTLIDMGEFPPAPASDDDEAPGGTAMLEPGQAPPLARKPVMPGDTMPTMMLINGPPHAAARKPGPIKQSSTNIMTAEESQAAHEKAMAKLQEAQQGVVRTRTRPDKSAPKKSNKETWIALGVGGLVAICGIIAILMFALADEAPSPRKSPRKGLPTEQEQADKSGTSNAAAPEDKPAPPPEEKKATLAPAEERPAPASKKEPRPAEEKPALRKQIASGKTLGVLTLNPGPNVPVVYAGNALPKQVGAFNLPVTAESGTIEVGDASTQFKVELDYAVVSGAMTMKINSVPWAIASVDGPSRGRTPVAGMKVERKMTVLELKRPGQENGMTVRLLFKPN